jgi:hypothetical protein
LRPMRPKPLIPTRIAMAFASLNSEVVNEKRENGV